MAYEKLLNEIYAAISLKYLWPEYKPFFIKSESPDWINENMDFGLEVSQALRPEDGQEEDFIEKFLGCRKEELPEDAVKRYGNRLHFYNERFWAVLPEYGSKQDNISKAKYRFEKKLEKLNTNYEQRSKNGLYLFLHPNENEYIDVRELFEYMKKVQNEKKVRFDFVFLNSEKEIVVCDFKKDAVNPIIIPKNARTFLNKEAESLRQSREWEDGMAL